MSEPSKQQPTETDIYSAPELTWKHPVQRTKYLWRTSLQFRAVAGAGALLAVAFLFVGSFLSHQIANSLFSGRLNQALNESSTGFTNVQSLLDSSDASGRTEIQRDVLRILSVLEVSGTETQREWLIAPNKGTEEGFIPAQSQSSQLTAADIPQDLRDSVSEGAGVFWQSSSLDIDGKSTPVLFIGTSVSIPQNPDYGLYLVWVLRY